MTLFHILLSEFFSQCPCVTDPKDTIFFYRINKFIDGSKKHIRSTILSTTEVREYAKETAQNIKEKIKELGYSFKVDDDDDDEEEEDQEDQYNEQDESRQEPEEQEEEEEEEEEEEDEGEEEENEEVIHIESDGENQSLSVLDPNYV